jgi:hypothetical protein
MKFVFLVVFQVQTFELFHQQIPSRMGRNHATLRFICWSFFFEFKFFERTVVLSWGILRHAQMVLSLDPVWFLGDSWNARRKPKTLNCQENWELWGIGIAKPFLVLNKMGTLLDEHKYWLIKSNESLHLVHNLCKRTRCPLTLHQCLHRWQASFKTCHLFSYQFYSFIKFSSITILKQFIKLSFNKFNMIMEI